MCMCKIYSELQLRWKIIFPFLAKSRAHTHTLYVSVCAWARDFARNGKIIFQRNCNALYLFKNSPIPKLFRNEPVFMNCWSSD